jgi:hypothetical protein
MLLFKTHVTKEKLFPTLRLPRTTQSCDFLKHSFNEFGMHVKRVETMPRVSSQVFPRSAISTTGADVCVAPRDANTDEADFSERCSGRAGHEAPWRK